MNKSRQSCEGHLKQTERRWEEERERHRKRDAAGWYGKLLTPLFSCGVYRESLYDLWVAENTLQETGEQFQLVLNAKPANPLKSYINIRILLMWSILRGEL